MSGDTKTLRYKLKRELPTFKVGEEFFVSKNKHLCRTSDGVVAYTSVTLSKFPNILKDWFEKMPEVTKTVWDLEKGDSYYYIGGNGGVQRELWTGHPMEERNRQIGNVYLEQWEVGQELARRRAKVILLGDTEGFKPDWSTERSHDEKYFVAWDILRDCLTVDYADVYREDKIYFANSEDAEASIQAHEKEWKTYLGVED